ncbi:hypothetical protein AMATHDRAFT_221 [Amanita thiersii Skay4041]|uniref:Uncharacterized protein n=1 Tax=Amanita thiersii Skay4041 TaxID=703135 RepID=A0A2A9NWW1_9AGAR|nr:hypothetical protein AMATHDRAFT_221 [Amanita thiersii Skay4041]
MYRQEKLSNSAEQDVPEQPLFVQSRTVLGARKTSHPSKTIDGNPSRARSVSSFRTTATRSTRNTLYGTPHGPHSRIEIIVPPPLAPTLNPTSDHNARLQKQTGTIVDQWV